MPEMLFSLSQLLGDRGVDGLPAMTYAGFRRRAIAVFVDGLLLMGVGFPALYWAWGLPVTEPAVGISAVWFLMAAYFIVLHAHWGRTVGKVLAGIKVRRLDGGEIGYR